jgi:hypothetical protein
MTYGLGEELKVWLAGNNPLAENARLYPDLLVAVLSEIDYCHVVRGPIDDEARPNGNEAPE